MRYKDDFSLQEIAEILDLSYNAVKSQHTRALASLKNIWPA
ncbi:MAG: sigma factor-like helix-turn-helix DNA-binding protein [Candidatus Moranbacteria bacterium]|nr:sigma factor-like helix-turn-helix DNA-binding protein [Candidatus Moranbacteria bacterium]